MTEHGTGGHEPEVSPTEEYVHVVARALVIVAVATCGLATFAAMCVALLISVQAGDFPLLAWVPVGALASATLTLAVATNGIPDPHSHTSAVGRRLMSTS